MKKMSLNKPLEEEVIGSTTYSRFNIKQVYSTYDNTVHWEYDEVVLTDENRKEEIKRQIKELQEELKILEG